jgi:hypothetical protein
MPAVAENEVDPFAQITFVPVIVQTGSGFTVRVAKLEVAVPQSPVITTLYLSASANVTGDIV